MNNNSPAILVDATVFMGMHAVDPVIRQQSTDLMSRYFHSSLAMSYEQVGLCDDYVWRFSRAVQDKYYPFMDCLHTEMEIQRIPYNIDDLMLATSHKEIVDSGLNCMQALLVAQVLRYDGILYTHHSEIIKLDWFSSYLGSFDTDARSGSESAVMFTDELDYLYQQSSCLQVEELGLF